jgi:hypothetical protein
MVANSFNAVPGRRVEKGESWSRVSRMDLGSLGRSVGVYVYAYAGKDGKFDKFEVQSADVKYEPPAPGAADPKAPFTLKKSDFQTKKAGGTILFDTIRGRVERSEFRMDLEGTLSIEIGGQTTEVGLSQTQNTTIRTTDTNPGKK